MAFYKGFLYFTVPLTVRQRAASFRRYWMILSIHSSIYLSTYLVTHLSTYLSRWIESVDLTIHPSIWPIHPSSNWSIYMQLRNSITNHRHATSPSTHRSFYLSIIYLSILHHLYITSIYHLFIHILHLLSFCMHRYSAVHAASQLTAAYSLQLACAQFFRDLRWVVVDDYMKWLWYDKVWLLVIVVLVLVMIMLIVTPRSCSITLW